MKEEVENKYVKRTQKDYTHTFILQVVQEVESGSISVGDARSKYGIQSHASVLRWV